MNAHPRGLVGAVTVLLLLMPPGALAGRIHRNAPIGMALPGDGVRVRYDAAGNPARVHVSGSIEQLQAVRTSTSRESWVMPDWRKKPARASASSSFDPATFQSSSFGSPGATRIVLRILRSNKSEVGGIAMRELHTNGLKTPGVSIAVLPGS